MLSAAPAAGVWGPGPSRLDEWAFSVLKDWKEEREKKKEKKRLRVADIGSWRVRVFPQAREVTITPWRPGGRQGDPRDEAARRAVQEHRRKVRQLELDAQWRRLIDEVDEANDVRAVRRARSMIRRMCRQYGLCRMWTLTYAGAGCHDRAQLVRDMEQFAREIKAHRPDVVWLGVPELHPGGHGWHVHVAVSDFISYRQFNPWWPYGHTETPKGPDGKPLAGKIDATVTAMYLCKYVAKSLGEGRTHLGQHRYFRPKGIQVEVVEVGGGEAGGIVAFDEARRVAIAFFGGEVPSYEWASEDQADEDWSGPPVAWLDFWRRRGRRDGA